MGDVKRKSYTDNEVRDAVRSLQKWRDEYPMGYPFIIGAVWPVLWALEKADPSLTSEVV
jgi:hypothetical protein